MLTEVIVKMPSELSRKLPFDGFVDSETVIAPLVFAVPSAFRRVTVMVPDVWPCTIVCGADVMTSEGFWTVSTWLPDVKPEAETLTDGVPALAGRYRKLAPLWPAAMVTEVMFAESAVLRNTPFAGLVASDTVIEPLVRGDPSAFWRWIVIVPDVTP